MIATSEMFTASLRARSAGPPCSPPRPVPGPGRLVVRVDELVNAINYMLAARPECDGLAVEAGPLSPALPDGDGCNWRAEGLRLRIERGASTRALAGVHQVVELARLRYDLAAPDDA